ncbi:Staphylococcal respiratory response protein A [uncultured Clostridium sp.]|nr:Staphylococcal respiratory response protein A [uncultured Clostridium sp.]
MSQNPLILICDDDPVVHESLGIYMDAEGYSHISAYDGEEGLRMVPEEHPDLMVLDLMMPKRSGIDVCREIRTSSQLPIIMLTARSEEVDRILGLELGADDYIVKPFSPREVLARIKAVLRRIGENGKRAATEILTFGPLEINLQQYQIKLNDQVIPSTPKEVEILHLLASQPGRVFSREQILSQVWGYDYFGDTRTVDTHIKRIRQKLPQNNVFSILTVYGVGYKFEVLA